MSNIAASYISEFSSLFSSGITQIVEAARIYVKAIDENPLAVNEFLDAFPSIPASAWAGFEAVGRGWMDSRLLWGGGRACLYLKRLPCSMQRAALDSGIDLLIGSGESLSVKVENLTIDQCKQAFDNDHVRSLAEQRAWIESNHKRPQPAADNNHAYEVKAGKLVIYRPVQISKRELSRLLWEIER